MNHAEFRKVCSEVLEGHRGDFAESDAHRSGVAVALAAIVPGLLDELERSREVPFGNAVVVGDIPIVEDGRKHTVRRAILIQFETEDEVREAIERRALVFGLFGETPEEV